MIETFGIVFCIEAADAMCKAADVEMIGFENTASGYISVLVEGDVGACKTAVAAGIKAVEAIGHEVYSSTVIARPHEGLKKIHVSIRWISCFRIRQNKKSGYDDELIKKGEMQMKVNIIDNDLLSIQEARILTENAYEAQQKLATFRRKSWTRSLRLWHRRLRLMRRNWQ